MAVRTAALSGSFHNVFSNELLSIYVMAVNARRAPSGDHPLPSA